MATVGEAAQQDRPSLEDILPAMMMPCLLYSGEEDGIFPQVQECVQQIPSATMVSFPSLNHPEAFYRADIVLPHVMKYLQEVSEGETLPRSGDSYHAPRESPGSLSPPQSPGNS